MERLDVRETGGCVGVRGVGLVRRYSRCKVSIEIWCLNGVSIEIWCLKWVFGVLGGVGCVGAREQRRLRHRTWQNREGVGRGTEMGVGRGGGDINYMVN